MGVLFLVGAVPRVLGPFLFVAAWAESRWIGFVDSLTFMTKVRALKKKFC